MRVEECFPSLIFPSSEYITTSALEIIVVQNEYLSRKSKVEAQIASTHSCHL